MLVGQGIHCSGQPIQRDEFAYWCGFIEDLTADDNHFEVCARALVPWLFCLLLDFASQLVAGHVTGSARLCVLPEAGLHDLHSQQSRGKSMFHFHLNEHKRAAGVS